MRGLVRRYGLVATLAVVCLALVLAGTGAALGYKMLDQESPRASPVAAQAASGTGGLAVDVTLDLATPLFPVDPLTIHNAPAPLKAAPLPGLSIDREISVEESGVGARLDLDVAAGSHRGLRDTGADASVSTSATRAYLAPVATTAAIAAAAAFTLAGAVVYFWGALKALATRVAVLPVVALYAKISRAEVFENTVRERIFAAIREHPGRSASDLSRLASVSWGTTIYHLDVLEQTRMVSSLRQGRYRRYFENGATLTGSKDVVAILQNTVTAGVVETIRRTPGSTQKDLAAATNMTPQALHWHLTRLVAVGCVRKEREGRVVRHFAHG